MVGQGRSVGNAAAWLKKWNWAAGVRIGVIIARSDYICHCERLQGAWSSLREIWRSHDNLTNGKNNYNAIVARFNEI